MIQFERTFDAELVKRIVTHPKIWPHISDDYSPSPQDYEPPMDPKVWNIIPNDGFNGPHTCNGVFILILMNKICWEIHTCLLPEVWGERAEEIGKGVVRWIFENTDCVRIVTNVPAVNRIAHSFALRCGLTEFGVNHKSYQKCGVLMDQRLLGISKEDICP